MNTLHRNIPVGKKTTATFSCIVFHDNKTATVNGWLLNHRLHAVWFLCASYPVSSWAGLSGLELPSTVHNLYIYISVLLLVRKQLIIDYIINCKDCNLKSILTTDSIPAKSKEWLDAGCWSNVFAFMMTVFLHVFTSETCVVWYSCSCCWKP